LDYTGLIQVTGQLTTYNIGYCWIYRVDEIRFYVATRRTVKTIARCCFYCHV